MGVNSGSSVKYGFIDKSGVEVISLKYDEVGNFSEEKPGVAKTKLAGKTAFIDKTGKESLLLSANYVGSFKEGLAEYYYDEYNIGNKKYGFLDDKGNEVIPRKYQAAEGFKSGLAKVKLNGKYGFIDKQDNIVIPFKYDFITDFADGVAIAVINQGEPMINNDNDENVEEYNSKIQKLYGTIDKHGNLLAQIIYNGMGLKFNEGLTWVKSNGQYGYIDLQGKLVIPLKNYIAVGDFHNGLAWVEISKTETFNQDKCYGCQYDKNGKIIKGEKTTEQKSETKKLYGYIDKQGTEVISPKYSKANDFVNGVAKVKLSDGSTITINKQGIETR